MMLKLLNNVDTVSDTLISKILLGTLGCVSAYDEYFVAAVRKYGVSTGVFNKKSIKKLSHFIVSILIDLKMYGRS